MAAVRLSPGVYRVGNKTVRAQSAAEAEKQAAGGGGNRQRAAKVADTAANINYDSASQGVAALPANVQKNIGASEDVSRSNQQGTIQGSNANQQGPFGSTTNTYDPNTGMWTQNTTLDPKQQAILDASQGLNKQGSQWSSGALGGFQQFQPGDYQASRDKAFNTAYDYLTRGMNQRKGQEQQQLEQSLHDRGIPFSNDPNSRYQQEMKSFTDSYADQERAASNQAYQASLAEQQTGFSQGLQTNQQQGSNITNMSGIGTGAQLPNQPAFQGAALNTQDPAAFNLAWQQLQLEKKKFAKDNQSSGGGSSGGGGGDNPVVWS